MSGNQEYSDNPAFLLLKALIAKQKAFHATGDGNIGGTTIVCTEMTGLPDFDGSQIHIIDPNSGACDQTRDIEGATTAGTITVKNAFGCQITQNTAFLVVGIRSTPVEVANLEAWIKTALGIEWDGTPDMYDALVTGGIPTYPAAKDIGNGTAIAEAIRAILTSMVGGDDYDNYTNVNNVVNGSLNAIFQNFAKLFAADGINIFNPTIQGSARTDLELALAALATYISANGAALSIQVNNQTARNNLEQVWEDYLAVMGCDNTNIFNPSIGGSARTDLDAALAAIGTIVGNPTGDTLTSLSTKWGDITRSLDLILGARWDAAGDLGTDVANIIAAIAGIQNNTRFTAAVPTWMCKPDAGDEAFRVSSNLYDTAGNMEDPENNEILVRIIKDDGTFITTLYKDNAFVAVLANPTDVITFPATSGWRAMEREAAGKFSFFNKVAHDATEESLTVEFGWTEGTKTNYQSRTTEIADVHGDLTAIKVETDKIANATYGLAAQNTYHWDKDISAYAGAKAGAYLKTLYDDWLNGGRLDLLLDGCSTHSPTNVRQSVCATGDPGSSIGKILYEVYINRLTTTRAGYLDELDFDLNARLDTKVAGKLQIAKTTEDLNQIAGTYDLLTGTTEDVLLESLLIRMPNIVAGGAITSISIQTNDTTPQVFISAADGALANLTAEAQLAWQNFNAPVLVKVGKKIQLTIAGGAHGTAYVCDIVAKVRAVTSGGYLA